MQYEDACDKIKDLEQHVSNMKQTIEELEGDLANKNDDYDRYLWIGWLEFKYYQTNYIEY